MASISARSSSSIPSNPADIFGYSALSTNRTFSIPSISCNFTSMISRSVVCTLRPTNLASIGNSRWPRSISTSSCTRAGRDSDPLEYRGAGQRLWVEIHRVVADADRRAGGVRANRADCGYPARAIRGASDGCAVVVQTRVCDRDGGSLRRDRRRRSRRESQYELRNLPRARSYDDRERQPAGAIEPAQNVEDGATGRRNPSVMGQLFRQMTVCGVGLIGGSLALIARREGLVGKVVGLGRTPAKLDVAVERGMIDVATRDPVEAARGADLIVLAVPILTMRSTLEKMIEHTAPDAVVTDVGSVKGYVIRELEPLITGKRSIVAAHPVAGKETTGAAAADPGLFRDRRVIITPSAKSTPAAIGKIEQLWDETGACVEMMDARTHDEILARSSHLPQIVSSVLAASLKGAKVGDKLAAEYGAGGLRDTTRLAASSWEMWRDIFVTNREAIAAALKLYGGTFAEFQRLVEAGDMEGVEKIFNRGRAMREEIR